MPRASLDKKPSDVAAMFDGIADRYDLTNDIISLGQDRAWRRATVRAVSPQPGERILDLAAGTGTSSLPFSDAGADVVPCDFSLGMLQVGKSRRRDLPFVAGDAMQLPFAAESFDAVTISFGLRNVSDTTAALSELFRVLRPGGRLVVCEFSTPAFEPLRTVYSEYLMKALPKVAGFVTSDSGSYDYLAESISQWPDQQTLGRMMRGVGFTPVRFRNLTGGIVALHHAVKPR
ncbi:demethylmenaquinone methyltransferase [Jonesia quinghaiensis]|uniref:demethylmenaquinone methyltransferase n=1 Tax=Jonesia quinghaiensis TaxID=262806 RepID=UPI00048B900A|nr:demethylmenaquinone methyltransferase [Jonesia quinghaiensis]